MGIIDRREIEFDARALIGVVAGSLQWAQTIGLLALRPTGVRFDPQERNINVVYTSVGLCAGERLGALLVSYCVRARLPMAHGAYNDLRIEAAAVVSHSARTMPTRQQLGDAAGRGGSRLRIGRLLLIDDVSGHSVATLVFH